MTSQPLYVWHHMHYICHHIYSLGHHTTLYMPQVHYIWPHVQCICVITPNLSVISQTLYIWHHIQYISDIISTIFMTEYPVNITSQHSLLMTPHSAYIWQSLHYKWGRIHSFTSNHSIYEVTYTSGMTSQPLYQTSHPLYLYHHTVSIDISPTLVWHHTNLLCDIIWTIYNITPNPYVITLLYLWYHSLYMWNHIQYEGNIYT